MGLFGLSIGSSPSHDFRDKVAYYQRIRPIRLRLNNELVRRLSRDALTEGARKIGILHNGQFVFENEDESSVLMDYCIYDVRRKGRNAIEQYASECPPSADPDEMACLRAMQDATYTLIAIDRMEPGVGCHVRNLFTEEMRLLVDMGLSRTGRPGAVIATRLLDFGGFVTTGGAVLPLGVLDPDELEIWQGALRAGIENGHLDPASLIRACLHEGASSYIRYEGEESESHAAFMGGSARAAGTAERKLARSKHLAGKGKNARCRCGSGKMFKNCCGKRYAPFLLPRYKHLRM